MGASKNWNAAGDVVQVTDYTEMQNIFSGGGNFSVWLFARSIGESQSAIWEKNRDVSELNHSSRVRLSLGPDSIVVIRVEQTYDFRNVFTASDDPINLNQWFHFSTNYNTNEMANKADLFINGVLIPSTRGGPTTADPLNSDATRPSLFGNQFGGSRTFDGLIAYPHMYDRELTQPEIKEIMHKPGSIRDGLVGCWPLTDEGSTQRNLSGIGNTGAVTGATSSNDGPPVTCFK